MKLTNIYNLPSSIVKAVENDDYDKGNADYSATELINSPLINRLLKEHAEEIEEDVSDRIFSLMGQAMHTILERSDDQLTEERLYANIDNFIISGKFDRIVTISKKLQDYKFMSVWEIIHGLKKEKEEQLNILAWLCYKNNIPIENVEIVSILRDWQKSKAKYDTSYPQKQVVITKLKLWSLEEQEKFISYRIKLQQDKNYICTINDRWQTDDVYAVIKRDNKRALKLHKSNEDAKKHLKNLPHGYRIDFRKGASRRCEDYCPVSEFCKYWRENK